MVFCKNCGKEIGDAKFCQYCGSSNDHNATVTINLVQNDLFTTIKEKIMQIGHEKLIKLIAWISTIINLIIRVVKNEIEVVYSVTYAQDDYYVISESGRNYMLLVIALQIILSVFLYRNAKKKEIAVSKKVIVLSAILLGIQILAMVMRFPAPY